MDTFHFSNVLPTPRVCFLCTPLCRLSWSGRANALPHPGSTHVYGRAPVCVRSCNVEYKLISDSERPSKERTCFDRLEDSAKPLPEQDTRLSHYLFDRIAFSPVAISAFERFITVMSPLMYRQSTGYRKTFVTSRIITNVGLYIDKVREIPMMK